MRHYSLGLMLIGLVLFTGVATITFAQGEADCDLQQIKEEYLEAIGSSQDWNELLAVLGEFHSAVAVCNNGYVRSGYGDGSLGPVELEQGTYVLEYESSIDRGEVFNYFNVHLEAITDDGESEDYIINDDSPDDPEREGEIAETNGSAVLRLNGGMYLFRVDVLNYRDWSLRLYKVD